MNKSPKISVIVPCFNCSLTVIETVGSVLSQTFSDYEILLIDDGSRDNTLKVLEDIQLNNPGKVRVIQQQNQGVSVARNHGIQESKGKYITFLDSDDLYAKTKLEQQLEAIQCSDADAIFATIERFEDTSDGRKFFNPTFPPEYTASNYPRSVLEMDLFSYANFSTGLFKKEVFRTLKWNSNRKTGEDWELWIEFALAGFKAKNLKATTNYYRKHANNSTKSYDTFMTLDSHLSILYGVGQYDTVVRQVAKHKVSYYAALMSYDGHRLRIGWLFLTIFKNYPNSLNLSALSCILKNILLPQSIRKTLSRVKRFAQIRS